MHVVEPKLSRVYNFQNISCHVEVVASNSLLHGRTDLELAAAGEWAFAFISEP